MGCGQSNGLEEYPEIDTTSIDDKYSRFEHQFPFYRTRIDIFEGRVKRFVNGRTSVSWAQLRYSFKDDKKWSDIQDETSTLCEILQSDYFQAEQQEDELDIYAIILWALILCAGDNHLKARVFYDVLQDNLQETISANDKDFAKNFNKLIILATQMTYHFEYDQNGGVEKQVKLEDELLETLREQFLDEVYGSSSKISREDYCHHIATKQPWIFNAKQIRDKVDQAMKKK